MTYLERCKSLLEATFYEGWVEDFRERVEASTKAAIDDFTPQDGTEVSIFDKGRIAQAAANIASDMTVSETLSFQQDFFKLLNYSLLSGDYVDTDKCIQEVSEMISLLEEVRNYDIGALSDFDVIASFDHFLRAALSCMHSYTNAIQDVKSRLDRTGIDILRQTPRSPDLATISNEYKNQVNMFSLNIRLTGYDLFYGASQDKLSDLLKIEEELNGYGSLKACTILEDKCKFLIKKLLYRYESLIDKRNEHKYITHGRFTKFIGDEIKPVTSHQYEAEIFTDFSETARHHYRRDTASAGREYNLKRETEIQKKDLAKEPWDSADYHNRTKWYKDEIKDDFKLLELIHDYEENVLAPAKELSEFNLLSLNCTYQYLRNNYLSLLCRLDAPYEQVRDEYVDICSLQSDYGVRNYFPHYKYAYWLIDNINKIIAKNAYDDEEELDQLIDELTEVMFSYEEAILWSDSKRFLPFQPKFEECCTSYSHEGEDITLFLASSFVLPLNYEFVRNRFNKAKDRLSRIKIARVNRRGLKKNKELLDKHEKDIKNQDKRHVEILGIFSAIVLFTVASVEFFDSKAEEEGISVHTGLAFLLTFGLSITALALIIRLVLAPSDKASKYLTISYGIIVLLAIALLVCVCLLPHSFGL